MFVIFDTIICVSMSAKSSSGSGGFVYSTNPDFFRKEEAAASGGAAGPQELRVWLEKNHRGGKTVTVVRGFTGSDAELEELGRTLRQKCGSGGSVKAGEILIQGDHRQKVIQWLTQLKHRVKSAGS
jgi:translation initiation factor 1